MNLPSKNHLYSTVAIIVHKCTHVFLYYLATFDCFEAMWEILLKFNVSSQAN